MTGDPTRTQAAALVAIAAVLCACPPPGAGPDAGPTDAGPDDAGSLIVCDAGPGEGEGEGEEPPEGNPGCNFIPEPFDDLYNDAGEPIYENCHWRELYLPCTPSDCAPCGRCRPEDCVEGVRDQQLVDTILAIAAARDYPPTLEFARVVVNDSTVAASILVTVDWLKFRWGISVLPNEDGTIDEQAVADEMPLWIPSSLPPVADVWAAIRSCDPDALPFFCYHSSPVGGYFVGECGYASLYLWDVDVVGSGMSEVVCYPDDNRCCEPAAP